MHLSPVRERVPAVYQTWEITICEAIPSVRSVAGLLSIQRVVMLRPPLQELELSVSVVRPPLTKRVFRGLRLPGSCRSRGWGPGNGCWGWRGEGWSRYGEFGPGGGSVCDSSDIALSPLVISDSSSSAGAGCCGTDLAEALSVHLSPIAPSMRKLYALKLRLRVRRPPAWSS